MCISHANLHNFQKPLFFPPYFPDFRWKNIKIGSADLEDNSSDLQMKLNGERWHISE